MKSSTPDGRPKGKKAEPGPTPTSLPYWEAAKRGVLQYQACEECAHRFLYPRLNCPACGSMRLTWQDSSGRATLHSYVISHIAAPGFEDDAPYVIAMVQLAEGPRLMSNIVGVVPEPDVLPLDMPLEVAFEERGSWKLPVFRPAGGKEAA